MAATLFLFCDVIVTSCVHAVCAEPVVSVECALATACLVNR